MKFWSFFKYEKPYLYLISAIFMIVSVVYYIDPNLNWQWNTFFYALALSFLIVGGFFLYRYHKTIQAIQNTHNDDLESLSLEAAYYQRRIEEMEREHIRSLNNIQEKKEEYDDFIVSWFHEVKTPISVLRLMQQTEIDPKSFGEEVDLIEHYVDQALYYAKLDSFNQDFDIRKCDLDRVIKGLIKIHSKTFISKRIHLSLHLKPTLVLSDSKWLHFIINQLLTNSLKYTNENGEVTISSSETSSEKILTIRDNGIGIEQKDLPRIFNRGFTGSTGRTYTKSTGMGLYLAQELSKKLGHYITCTSVVNQFTEFLVHFPKNVDLHHNITKTKKRNDSYK